MIEIMLRGLIFAASVAGYLMLLNKKYDIAIEFAPAIYCSGVSSVMFFAGILNMMPEIAAAITIGGLLCVVWGIRNRLRFSLRTWIVVAGFGAVLLYFMWLLWGVQFTGFDNFTHWGVAIREMLLEDRMPNFSDSVVLFQAYPMGTAVWAYYMCRVIGLGPTCFAFVQQIMQLSFLLPVFAWVTREKWYLALLPIVYALYAMVSNVVVSDLLVDSIMPIAAVALFSIAFYYQNEKEKVTWCTLPLLVFLMQVKNSGVFFVAVYILYIAFNWKRELIESKRLSGQFFVLNVLAPIVSLFLWNKHVKYGFPDAGSSVHAMSLSYFKRVSSQKSIEDILEIFSRVLDRATSLKSDTFALMVFLTIVIVMAIVCSTLSKKPMKKWANLLGAAWLIYILYIVGLIATYIFSMAGDDYQELLSFDRYLQTFGIFILGFSVPRIIQYFEVEGMPRQRIASVISVTAAVLIFWNPMTHALHFEYGWAQLLHRTDDSMSIPLTVERDIGEYGGGIPSDMHHYIYLDSSNPNADHPGEYLKYVLRYEFRTGYINIFDDFETWESNFSELDAHYLYIWTPDDASDAFLRENDLGEKCGQRVIVNLMGLKN